MNKVKQMKHEAFKAVQPAEKEEVMVANATINMQETDITAESNNNAQ